MRERVFACLAVFVVCAAMMLVTAGSVSAQKALPNPVLVFAGAEPYTASGGQQFTRYRYFVFNSDVYPDALFAPAPSLPPCGANTNASRTWVDLFAQGGTRLYGFCALGRAADLNTIWFALPADQIPPSYIYIEMSDRQTNIKYKSNLADTVM